MMACFISVEHLVKFMDRGGLLCESAVKIIIRSIFVGYVMTMKRMLYKAVELSFESAERVLYSSMAPFIYQGTVAYCTFLLLFKARNQTLMQINSLLGSYVK
jgi:hypothetical protein